MHRIRKFLVVLRFKEGPDFMIIGTAKGGTTSLYNYISEYVLNFKSPIKKEIKYYNINYYKGKVWYKSHFPNKKKGMVTGEATPDYLFHMHCPERIYKDYPNVKIIVLLRNPIDRAYSHYNFIKKIRPDDFEPNSIFDAFQMEEERLAAEIEKVARNKNYYSEEYRYYSYKLRGKYDEQIERWLNYYPRNQILFIKSESFFENPKKELDKVVDFIGGKYKPNTEFYFTKYNSNKYTDIDSSIVEYLSGYYIDTFVNLQNILGSEFNWE